MPFGTICGVSAGGLNAVFLGGWLGDFEEACHRLRELWLELSPERVFRTDGLRMLGIGGRWMRDLSAGGLFHRSRINYLLDATPLRDFLHERLPLADLRRTTVARKPPTIEEARAAAERGGRSIG